MIEVAHPGSDSKCCLSNIFFPPNMSLKRSGDAGSTGDGKKKGKFIDHTKRGGPGSNHHQSARLNINDPKCLRGYAMVSCTFDNGKESQATAELHRLISEHIEIVHGAMGDDGDDAEEEGTDNAGAAAAAAAEAPSTEAAPALTASDLMQRELDELKGDASSSSSSSDSSSSSSSSSSSVVTRRDPRRIATVRTSCKGVVMVRIGSQQPLVTRAENGGGGSGSGGGDGDQDGASSGGDSTAASKPTAGSGAAGATTTTTTTTTTTAATATTTTTTTVVAAGAVGAKFVDVVKVCGSVFRSVAASQEPVSRHVIRFVPLQWTCFAGLPEVFAVLPPLVAAHFGPGSEPGTFMVATKRRNNQEFDKDAVVRRIVELVGPRHTVSLANPRRVVVVEVIQALCGLSVVDGHEHGEFVEFNLRKFQDRIRKSKEAGGGMGGGAAVAVAVAAVEEKGK